MEPRPARRIAFRQRASRGGPRSHRAQPLAEAPWWIWRWPGGRVPPLPVTSRRPLRKRRVAAGASGSAHQTHLGQPRAREPEDRRDARSCERGCDPSRLRGPLARASRLDPSRHGGRGGRLDARLWPFARRSDRLGGRVQRVLGSKLQGTWLRRRSQPHQARAHLPALGDPGPRQHGGAPHRPRVDPDRASIENRPPGRSRPEPAGGGSSSDRPGRRSSPRRTRRLRGGTGALLALEGACSTIRAPSGG